MNNLKMVRMDRPRLQKLKAMYKRAKKRNQVQFNFEGSVLLVDYAKYLIQYLEKMI